MGKFKKVFKGLADPRAANAQHALLEILFIGLAAVLCGAESASDMERFAQSKEALLRQILGLEHGIPSHDTFSRVFRLLDPRAFEIAIRASDSGQATDDARLRQIVEPVLAAGALPVAAAIRSS